MMISSTPAVSTYLPTAGATIGDDKNSIPTDPVSPKYLHYLTDGRQVIALTVSLRPLTQRTLLRKRFSASY